MLIRNDTRGFTIVELLVVIAVAGIMIGSLSEVVTTYVHTAQRGRYLSLANAYVEAKIEAMRNAGYNSLNVGTYGLASELPAQLPPGRSATMTITNPYVGIKQADITVSYNDQGLNNSYSYTTYIGELGVEQ